MDILKILQKRRNEDFLREESFENVNRRRRERFKNEAPRFVRVSDPVVSSLPVDEVLTVSVEPDSAQEIPLRSEFAAEPERTRVLEAGTAPLFLKWELEAALVNPRLVAITQPQSVYCEQYRKLRTYFLNLRESSKIRSVVIASYGASEGKSITAGNLALLLAQVKGLRVLLVDADMRRSTLADYFGFEPRHGLADVLSGNVKINDAVIKLLPAGLHFLASGGTRPDISELVSGDGFKDFMARALTMFDSIIFDVPPIGLFTDAAALAAQTDATILVARSNSTSGSDISEAMMQIPREKIVAGVLSHYEMDSSDKYRRYEDR